jgi:Tetratricopeptide repeat
MNMPRIFVTGSTAEPLLEEALQIRQNVLGPEHPYTTSNLNNLALLEFDIAFRHDAEGLAA